LKQKLITLFVVMALMMGFTTSVFARDGGGMKLSKLKAACNADDLYWQIKVENAPRMPIKISLWIVYQEGSPKEYAKLANQYWTVWVSKDQAYYEDVVHGGCLVPMWAWEKEVKIKIAAQGPDGQKLISKNWLEPYGVFYPDNQAKYLVPSNWLDNDEKTLWKKYRPSFLFSYGSQNWFKWLP
jgi:hypothetical protein